MTNNIPPQSIDSERAVLGAAMLDISATKKAVEILKPDHFYVPNHQVIFQFIQKIHNKGLPVDLVTISEELRSLNLLDDLGGQIYLMNLLESVPTTANTEQYANIVKGKFVRREIIRTAEEVKTLAYQGDLDTAEVLDQTEQKLSKLNDLNYAGELVHISQFLDNEWEAASEAKEKGYLNDPDLVSTGMADIDHKMSGGLNPSDLVIIAARPGIGKTSFCLNIAANIAKKYSYAVPIFSFEMSGKQLSQRLISSEAEINLYHIKTRIMTDSMFSNYSEHIANLRNLPIYIGEKTTTSIHEMKAQCRKLKSKYKKIGAIIIDYLQIMDLEDENEAVAIGKITKAAKRMAKDLNVPVILLSQLNRMVEQRANKRPHLSDLKSSGSIEADADIVMFIYRDEYYNPGTDKTRIAEIDFAKNRNGETGPVEVYFDGAFTKFSGLEK